MELCPSQHLNSSRLLSSDLAYHSIVPPEIYDRIIDHVHDDLTTLRRCSLVCRSWLPTSSLHLFHSFSWPPCYHAGWGWESRVCKCRTLDQSSFLQELHAFCEASPRVRAHVRTLNLACHWSVVDREWERTDYNVRISLRELQRLLALLSSLRELSIDRLSLRPLRETLLPIYFSLNKLTLHRPSPPTAPVADSEVLLDFFSIFNSISTLKLGELWESRDVQVQPRTRRTRVDNLLMISALPAIFCQYIEVIKAGMEVEHITTLNTGVFWCLLVRRSEFRAFLRAAKNLRSLAIHSRGPPLGLDIPEDPSATRYGSLCPALQELIVVARAYHEWSPHSSTRTDLLEVVSAWSDACTFLARRPFPSIRKLTLEFMVVSWGTGADHIDDSEADSQAGFDLKKQLAFLDWSLLDVLAQAYPSPAITLVMKLSVGSQLLYKGDDSMTVENLVRSFISPRANESVQLVVF